MTYKVFLVEDEIVTREGIRDAVDWAAAGYQFCGEAPDGEIALPLIREREPDIVITDIKMPFMDGLQLCRILRETLPATRIVILSGHDEFRYAQEAIQIGVTEYLLKPIVAQDLLAALRKIAGQIDEERQTRARLEELQAQMANHQPMLRERCLLDLVSGNSSAADFIEQARSLGIDLLAPWYQVLLIRAVPAAGAPIAPLYAVCQRFDAVIAEIIGDDRSVVAFKQGLEDTILIVKGETQAGVAGQAQALAAGIGRRVAEWADCQALIAAGDATERLGLIARSFGQARAQLSAERPAEAEAPVEANAQQEQPHGALIMKARAYIDANYADPEMSLGQAAAQVLLSPTYFSAVFRREVGETFIDYLTHVRIRKAIELLRSTSLTSSEIAYRIGYQNPRYFYSVFRKVVGQPPNEFRRRA
jgi:two-component system, response regulator YesN